MAKQKNNLFSLNFLDYNDKFIFPFYFDFYNKKLFRYALYNYDFFFTPKISKSYVYLDLGLKKVLKLPLFYFYKLFPYKLKGTRLFFWREFRFLVYNSFSSAIIFNNVNKFNLKFSGYFPFSYYNFISFSSLGFLNKFDEIFWEITSHCNYGYRRINETFTDVDLHISSLLFNSFKRFEGISFFRFFCSEIFIVNNLPNTSVFVSFYDNFKRILVQKYFFNLHFKMFFFRLKKHFFSNLFTSLSFELSFYCNVVKFIFFSLKNTLFGFIKNIFFYKKIYGYLNFYYFFKLFLYFFNKIYLIKYIFYEFLILSKKKHRKNLKNLKRYLFKFFYLFIFKFNLCTFLLSKKNITTELKNKQIAEVKHLDFFGYKKLNYVGLDFLKSKKFNTKKKLRINFLLANPFNSFFFKNFQFFFNSKNSNGLLLLKKFYYDIFLRYKHFILNSFKIFLDVFKYNFIFSSFFLNNFYSLRLYFFRFFFIPFKGMINFLVHTYKKNLSFDGQKINFLPKKNYSKKNLLFFSIFYLKNKKYFVTPFPFKGGNSQKIFINFFKK